MPFMVIKTFSGNGVVPVYRHLGATRGAGFPGSTMPQSLIQRASSAPFQLMRWR